MIEYKNNSNTNIAELVITDTIITGDVERVAAKMNADIEQYGDLRILEEFRDFDGIDPIAHCPFPKIPRTWPLSASLSKSLMMLFLRSSIPSEWPKWPSMNCWASIARFPLSCTMTNPSR